MDFSIKAVFGVDATGVKTELKQLRKETNDAANSLANMGLAAAGAAFVALSKGAVDLAASLKDSAGQIGINVESLQALNYAAEQNGSSQEQMQKSLEKTARAIQKAREGDKASIDTLSRLKLTWEDLAALPLEKKYERVAQAYVKADDKAQAYNAVCELFGDKVGPKMIETLTQLGTDGFDKVAKSAAEAGHIMSAETIVALERADQAIADFKKRATIAVGDVLVNFQSEEGLKLLLFQLLKAAGSFGAGIVDAVIEGGQMVWAVMKGAFVGTTNILRDGLLEASVFFAQKWNEMLPDFLKSRGWTINISGIEEMKSAGKSIGDEITAAIASTEPSTFKKEVGEFWDQRIDAQRKVVAELNKKDFGEDAAKLRTAGEDIRTSLAIGASDVKKAGDHVGEKIKEASRTVAEAAREFGEQMRMTIATWSDMQEKTRVDILGARGAAQFSGVSDEALAQLIRRNSAEIQRVTNPALDPRGFASFDARMEAARLQTEINNAQRELDLRNNIRRNFANGGAEAVYRANPGTDPLILDQLIQRFGQQLPQAERTATAVEQIARGLIRRGIIPQF